MRDDDGFWPQAPGPAGVDEQRYAAADDAVRRIAAQVGVPAPPGLRRAAEVSAARAAFRDDYARLVAETRATLTEIAARTTLARLTARAQDPPGDPSADRAVELANLRGQAEAQAAADAAEQRGADLAAGHGAALSGLMPLAGLGSAAGGGAHRPTRYDVPQVAPDDLDLRLRELCGALTGPVRGWVRLAVASVVDESGRPCRVIGTTELDGYLRPGIELRDGELAAGNEIWPELSIATFCAAHGFTPGPVIGAVEPPPDVYDHLRALGFEPSWAPDAWATSMWEADDASVG